MFRWSNSSFFVYFAILLYFGIEHSTCMILNFIFIIYIYIYTKILFFTWCQSDKCCWCWKWREGRRQKFLFSWNYCWIFVLLLFVIYINIYFFVYTEAQFERCLDQLFTVNLNEVEAQALLSKYGNNPQQKGMVCYRDFCATVDARM